jgi:imidazolonepropionase-like amidohydrolase
MRGSRPPSKRADLLLVDANPLDDATNVFRTAGVMVQGRWLSRRDLDEMLEAIARSNGSR